MSSTTIAISGMTCSHCTSAVEEAVAKLPGVTAVDVSLENKTAVVEHNSEVDFLQIKAAVESVGFYVG